LGGVLTTNFSLYWVTSVREMSKTVLFLWPWLISYMMDLVIRLVWLKGEWNVFATGDFITCAVSTVSDLVLQASSGE
jgi:hypothetical protein